MRSPADQLFRVYLDPSSIESYGQYEGYPRAWRGPTWLIDVGTERPFWTWLDPGDGFPPEQVTEFIGIKDIVRKQAGHRCVRCGHPYRVGEMDGYRGEWTPCDEQCTHGGPVREAKNGGTEAQWRILTVHHLNGVKHDCRWWNLVALCQRCHLTIQGRVVMERRFYGEHSEWFKPYVAGFYAWRFLEQEIGRDEAVSRLDELLALEHVQLELSPAAVPGRPQEGGGRSDTP